MRRLLRTVLGAALAVALPAGLLVAASPGSAGETLPTHCIPSDSKSPKCGWRKAKVTFVADGDTIDVTEGGKSYRVRFTDVNTMEMSVYSHTRSKRRGECHAVAATNRLEDLIAQAGWTVYLAAQNPKSMSGNRYRRSVWTKIGGTWRDLGLTQIREGRALWAPNPDEWAHKEYNYAAQYAAAHRVGIYDTDACGSGPSQTARLSMWVNWDASGGPDNSTRVNGEWAYIYNSGPGDLSLSGWWFRDTWVDRYKFPRGAKIPAGKGITLYMGKGRNTSTKFYWGRTSAVFNNVDSAHGQGEGGYLFDPQGDLRTWSIYPCVYRCASPARGKVSIKARAKKPEYIDIRNTGRTTINLRGHVLKTPPYIYPFMGSTPIAGGKTLRIYLQGSPKRNSTYTKFWGFGGYVLNDSSDVVSLRTFDDQRIACHRWGNGAPCWE
jgi:endonuclease YncB( thermonuclease family)